MDRPLASLPPWFQRWGVGAWLVVGMVLVVLGGVWLLATTSTIVAPLIVGAIIGAVGGAVVDRAERRGLPRAAGAALLTLALALLAVAVVAMVLGGITSQETHIDGSMSHAVDKVRDWLDDIGVGSASAAADEVKQAVPEIGRALLHGVVNGVSELASLVAFVGMTVFASFFLLKDGPGMGRWIEQHMGMRPDQARIVTGNIVRALRLYFLGMTIVGAFNAAIVAIGAAALGVPLPGTIAVVTFLASYIPIVGAWTAGIFVFALALADEGSSTALIMGLIVFLANGPLQQIVQPIAYGATLQLNPLVVFSVTIGAGALFGIAGLVLAAPLVSAAVRTRQDFTVLNAAPAQGGG
ncbi:MAG TPA: AI-2E family transporter [Thermoleophilaceae bacterium]|nr:AI-2E family transporter [Thermoleophilaceae bacterium]